MKLKGYLDVYEMLLRTQGELTGALDALVSGQSPYVKLGIVRDMAEEARTKWHTLESQRQEEENV